VQQVGEHLGHPGRVRLDGVDAGRHIDDDALAHGLGVGARRRDGVRHCRSDGNAARAQNDLALVDARDVQQVFDQVAHLADLPLHDGVGVARLRFVEGP
jgi:hypothetical protein